MPVFNNVLAGAAAQGGASDEGYIINRSIRFDANNASRLQHTYGDGTGNRNKVTFSFWAKFYAKDYAILSAGDSSSYYFEMKYNSHGQIEIFGDNLDSTSTVKSFVDPNAWYHICLAVDKGHSQGSERIILYVNGVRVALTTSSQSSTSGIYWGTGNVKHRLGGRSWASSDQGNFYFTEFYLIENFVPGTSTDNATGSVTGIPNSTYITEFVEFDANQVVQPKAYTGSFPGKSVYLKCSDNSSNNALGNDSSGNNRHYTVSGLNATHSNLWDIDSLVDTPTNYTASSGNNGGNYCVLNPLTLTGGTLKKGNLEYVLGSGTRRVEGSMAVKSGKWYWEARAVSGVDNGTVGGRFSIVQSTSKENPENTDFNLGWHAGGNLKIWRDSGSTPTLATGTSYTNGDILGCALDADTNIAKFYKNGSLVYTIDFSSYINVGSAFLTPSTWNGSSGTPEWIFNFGASGGWYHNPPSGYNSLCTKNLEDPLIGKGNDHFAAIAYTGSSGDKTVTTGFAPDIVWLKNRSQSRWHRLADRVRGVTKNLFPNDDDAETTSSDYNHKAFTNTGFTIHDTDRDTNSSHGDNYVSWSWNAGSSNSSFSVSSLNASSFTSGTYATKWNDTSAPGSTGTVNAGGNAFDGKLSTYASLNTSNAFTKWKPNAAIQINSSLRVLASGISSGDNQVAVNGNYFYVTSDPQWYTITGEDYLVEIRLRDVGSTHGRLWAVEVDGKILVDNNSTAPNTPTVASTCRANTDAGISICSWAGVRTASTSVRHGLNQQPEMIWVKNREHSTSNWIIYHKSIGGKKYIRLNHYDGQYSASSVWQDMDPTSGVFFVGQDTESNGNNDMIAYCFHSVPGFSHIGQYQGTGNENFVYTGFKPAWVMIKRYTDNTVGQWSIYDNGRTPYNEIEKKLWADGASSEENHPNNGLSFMSNGFVLDYGSNSSNVQYTNNGNVGYLYIAFAQHPFKTARAR